MEWLIAAVVVLLVAAVLLRRRPRQAPAPMIVAPLTEDARRQISDLIAQDQPIKAIKRLRELQPGLSLAEAKYRVEHWDSAEVREQAEHGTGYELPADLAAEVDQMIARDDVIKAIKRVRERTGLGLKDAKSVVDARLPRQPRG